MSAAVAWLVAMVLRDAERWGWQSAKELVVGSPMERALARVTDQALAATVDQQLGPAATPEARARVIAVLDELWPRVDPFDHDVALMRAAGFETSVIERVRDDVTRAMAVARTPLLRGEVGEGATSSLSALALELGVRIDEVRFVDDFTRLWVAAVRDAATRTPALAVLADQLGHDETQALMARLTAELGDRLETSVGRQIHEATEVLAEVARSGSVASWDRRERWFRFHIEPIDASMDEIFADYTDGFTQAIAALQARRDLETFVPLLHELRSRGYSSRINTRTMAAALERAGGDDPALSAALIAFATAVQRFFNGADPAAAVSWYSYYIETFSDLVRRGRDPHDRDSYAIAGSSDLAGAALRSISDVPTNALPAAFARYKEAYAALRAVALPL